MQFLPQQLAEREEFLHRGQPEAKDVPLGAIFGRGNREEKGDLGKLKTHTSAEQLMNLMLKTEIQNQNQCLIRKEEIGYRVQRRREKQRHEQGPWGLNYYVSEAKLCGAQK